MGLFSDDTIKRFWSKISIGGEGDCWEWQQFLWDSGYGSFWANGRSWRAHRVALIIHTGFVAGDAPEWLACHTCDNKRCCNPRHLYWGSARDNRRDCMARGNGRAEASMFQPGHVGIKATAKLLPSQVAYIKALLAAGYTQREIGLWYEVGPKTIGAIHRGVNWRDVEPHRPVPWVQ